MISIRREEQMRNGFEKRIWKGIDIIDSGEIDHAFQRLLEGADEDEVAKVVETIMDSTTDDS